MRNIIFFLLYASLFSINDTQKRPKSSNNKPTFTVVVPYFASIEIELVHIVSGCLISVDHILTTARGVVEIIKRGGENYANTTAAFDCTLQSQFRPRYGIEDLHHYHYTPENLYEIDECVDAGVILLKESVMVSEYVNWIPMSNVSIKGSMTGYLALWNFRGIDGEYCNGYKLKSMKIKLENFKICGEIYSQIKTESPLICGREYERQLTATMADPGTPLVRENLLLGITTATDQDPIIFLKINYVRDYIINTMRRLQRKNNQMPNSFLNEMLQEQFSYA